MLEKHTPLQQYIFFRFAYSIYANKFLKLFLDKLGHGIDMRVRRDINILLDRKVYVEGYPEDIVCYTILHKNEKDGHLTIFLNDIIRQEEIDLEYFDNNYLAMLNLNKTLSALELPELEINELYEKNLVHLLKAED